MGNSVRGIKNVINIGELLLEIHKASLGCTVTPAQLTATKEQAFDLFPDRTLYLLLYE
jgi:hypothetical protein